MQNIALILLMLGTSAFLAKADDIKLAPSQMRQQAEALANAISSRISEAKKQYDLETTKLKEDILKQLDTNRRRAREAGNTPLVMKLNNERDLFERIKLIPASIDAKAYREGLSKAKNSLASAYWEASREFTRAGMDEKAAEMQNILNSLTRYEHLTGSWRWGQNKILFRSDGTFKEYIPSGSLGSSGVWFETTENNIVLRHDNGWTSLITLNADGASGKADCTSPSNQMHTVEIAKIN